jgi:hypothetical protein
MLASRVALYRQRAVASAAGALLLLPALAAAQDVTFEPPRVTPLSGSAAAAVVRTGDFNHDGLSDFAVFFSAQGSGIAVYAGTGDGGFVRAGGTGSIGTALAWGDVNGDGYDDLVVASTGSNTITVLPGGSAGLGAAISSPRPAALPQFVVGDFNGDGHADLAGPGAIVFGQGDGTFSGSVALASSGTRVAAGDLNQDGRLDLVLADPDNQAVVVLAGHGDGTFEPAVSYPAGGGPVRLALADMDGNGFLDIVTAFSGSVSILRGRADHTFSAPSVFATGTTGFILEIADFSGDGIPDAAVPWILTGDGEGNLGPPVQFPGTATNMAVGHFNDDGRPDLVAVTGSEEVTISIILNSTGVPHARQSVVWTNLTNSVANFNTLSHANTGCDTVPCFNASGFSAQQAEAGDAVTAGFSFDRFPSQSRLAGLTHESSGTTPGRVDFGFGLSVDSGGVLDIREHGVVRAVVPAGWRGVGQQLRVVVGDGTVKYYADDELVYTSSAAPQYPLRMIGLPASAGSIDNAWLQVTPGSDDGGGDGGGAPATWTDAVNVEVSANALRKTSGCDGCFDAGAAVSQSLDPTAGFLEFRLDDPSQIFEAGLASSASARMPAEIDFGLLSQGGGWVEVRERGIYRADAPVQAGDRLRVSVDAGTVSYAVNDAVFYTSAATATSTLYGVVGLATTGASVSDVIVGGAGGSDGGGGGGETAWSGDANATVAGGSVRKTSGCDGCFDAGAVADALIGGDGFVEFTVDDPRAILEAGLASSRSAVDPADIDFGIMVQGGGWIEVREHAVYRYDAPIAAGDVIRISVQSGVVRYAVNGTPFYTSAMPASDPLSAVVRIATVGGSVSAAVVDGEP